MKWVADKAVCNARINVQRCPIVSLESGKRYIQGELVPIRINNYNFGVFLCHTKKLRNVIFFPPSNRTKKSIGVYLVNGKRWVIQVCEYAINKAASLETKGVTDVSFKQQKEKKMKLAYLSTEESSNGSLQASPTLN